MAYNVDAAIRGLAGQDFPLNLWPEGLCPDDRHKKVPLQIDFEIVEVYQDRRDISHTIKLCILVRMKNDNSYRLSSCYEYAIEAFSLHDFMVRAKNDFTNALNNNYPKNIKQRDIRMEEFLHERLADFRGDLKEVRDKVHSR